MNLDLLYETVEHIPVGIFILDAGGNYVYVNQAYCDTVQKSKEFFQHTSIPKLREQGYLTTNVWEQVMEKKQKVVSVISITDEHLNRVYDTLTTGTPLFDQNGDIAYIIYRQEAVDTLYEYLQKGALNKHIFRSDEARLPPPDDVIAESSVMKQLLNMVAVVAKTDASILVTGPSGSGKEVIAKRVHQLSNHHRGPMVVLNCAALPESLMESELFGYEKGAFTGATGKGKMGLIEAANQGTLFLDEINSMPLAVQAKLLRVLETKQVLRVGAVEAKDIQFRLVCASNEDLQQLVEEKRFRADLFYRINVISVEVPPLSKRRDDIYPLARYFMEQFCRKYNRIKVLSSSIVDMMQDYDWPGNVRELRNFVERMVIMSPEDEWEVTSVPVGSFASTMREDPSALLPQSAGAKPLPEEGMSLRGYMEQQEKELIEQALRQYKTPKEVAHRLHLNLSNVYRKMQKYGISV